MIFLNVDQKLVQLAPPEIKKRKFNTTRSLTRKQTNKKFNKIKKSTKYNLLVSGWKLGGSL